MKIIIILLLLTQICYGQTVLHRYTDILTNEERGICYSSKDGTPAVSNPDYNVEVIDENQKQFYIKEHQKQLKVKANVAKANLKAKKKIIKDKLKAGTPLSQQDVDLLVGD